MAGRRARARLWGTSTLALVGLVIAGVVGTGRMLTSGAGHREQPVLLSAVRAPVLKPPPLPTPARSPAGATASLTGLYHVVGLGDSVPAAGACGCESYVSLIGEQLAQRKGRNLAVNNLAVGGLTTSGLQTQLEQPAVRAAIVHADLVIVTVGANDFDPKMLTTSACQPVSTMPCYQDTLNSQHQWLTSVLAQVNGLITPGRTRVVVTGYWNVFLDGQLARDQGDAYVQASTALTLSENALIESISTTSDDSYVDIYTPFKGDGSIDDTDLLTPDGEHPNEAGHQLIADTLLAALRSI